MMRKTVFITGASSGIGKIASIYFHEMDWNVVAAMRTPAVENELTEFDRIKCIHLDVLEEDSIKSAIAETIAVFGGIDVIVNCAGYALVGPFEPASKESMLNQFNTNVFGTMNVIRHTLPHFRSQKRGVIINLTIGRARKALPLNSFYNSASSAIEGFSESLQFELFQFGIKVKLVEPTSVATDFYGRSQEVVDSGELTIYEDYVDLVMPNLQKLGIEGIDAVAVAEKIYKAANDNSSRFRYGVGAGQSILFWLKGKIPYQWYLNIVRRKIERRIDRLSKYKNRE